MEKDNLSHSILNYLYKNDCIGFCDIIPYLKTTQKNEKEIKSAVSILRQNKWIEVIGDWGFLGGTIAIEGTRNQGTKITLNNAHLSALITEQGIKYYKDYLERKNKYKYWIPIGISSISLVFAGIATYNGFNSSEKSSQTQKQQEKIEKGIQKIHLRQDSLTYHIEMIDMEMKKIKK